MMCLVGKHVNSVLNTVVDAEGARIIYFQFLRLSQDRELR